MYLFEPELPTEANFLCCPRPDVFKAAKNKKHSKSPKEIEIHRQSDTTYAQNNTQGPTTDQSRMRTMQTEQCCHLAARPVPLNELK